MLVTHPCGVTIETLSPGKGQAGEVRLKVTCTQSVKIGAGIAPRPASLHKPEKRGRLSLDRMLQSLQN